MAGESITFDFVGRGANQLGSDFRKVGDNAALAAKGARLCADAIEKQRKAASVSAGATLALAKADDILKEAEQGLAEGALEAEFALKKQAAAAKEAAAESAAAGAAAGAGASGFGSMGGALGAAIAAGVALSPVLVTLGAGLGGLGIAALSLDKKQRAAALSASGLTAAYKDFGKAVQPVLFRDLAAGAGLAGNVLRDLQPVTVATGKALGGFLGQIDAEFKSKTWQDFFGFMAAQAGPDMRLVASALLPLLDTLPKLLTDLQPIAVQFLQAAAGATKLADSAITLNDKIQHLGSQADHSSGFMGKLADAGKRALGQILPGVPAAQQLGKALGILGGTSAKTGGQMADMGGSAAKAAVKVLSLEQQVTGLTDAEDKALSPLLAYSNALIAQRNDANSLSDALKKSHDRIGLNTAEQRASFSAANTYIQDLLNTAAAANKSHQGIDAQIRSIEGALPQLRNVRGGTRLYWQEVSTLVTWLHRLQAIKRINEAIHVSGTGIWTVTPGKIGLPGGSAGGPFAAGGKVTGGTAGRDSVPIMAMPGEVVVPTHMVSAGAVDHLRGRLPGFAAGGVVGSWSALPGLGPWAGRELRATESAIGRSVAQALIAGIKSASVAGGVGNYKPGAGVQQWRGVAQQALRLAGANVAQLTDPVLYQMQTESGGNPYAVNKWDSNWLAGHPSVGLMQVIRGTFQAYAGRFRNTGPFAYGVSENPLANVYSAIRYAQANYGPGLRNAYGGIGTGHGYDKGGWLMPGATLAINNTGRPEQVIPPGGTAAGGLHLHLTVNGPIGSQQQLEDWYVKTANKMARTGRLTQAVRTAGR